MSRQVSLGNEFNGFVVLMKLFRDVSWLAAGTSLYSWCLASVACLDLSVLLATVRLMSGVAMPASRRKLSMLVYFKQPVMIRQQSWRAGSVSLVLCRC